MNNSISVKISKAALSNALGKVQMVVASKNTLEILSNVKIDATNDKITITATDMDISISETAKATVDVEGTLTLSARKLYEIVRKMSGDDDIAIRGDAESGRVQIKSKGCKFTLPCLNSDDFPIVEKNDMDCKLNIAPLEFLSLLNKTKFAMSTEEARYYLQGVNLKVEENNLIAHATNGHKLAKNFITLTETLENFPNIIVPLKSVGIISKIFENSAIELNIEVSDKKISITQGSLHFISKLVDGNFPDVDRIIPKSASNILGINRELLLRAIDRISIASSDKENGIKIFVSKNELKLTASSETEGQAEEIIEIESEIESIERGFNFKYLIETLSNIDSLNVTVNFNDNGIPCSILNQNNPNEIYLIMGMKV